MFNRKSSYALNKKDPDAIVYMDANEVIVRLTREDFASEEEFLKWKALSDEDSHVSEKEAHVYSRATPAEWMWRSSTSSASITAAICPSKPRAPNTPRCSAASIRVRFVPTATAKAPMAEWSLTQRPLPSCSLSSSLPPRASTPPPSHGSCSAEASPRPASTKRREAIIPTIFPAVTGFGVHEDGGHQAAGRTNGSDFAENFGEVPQR